MCPAFDPFVLCVAFVVAGLFLVSVLVVFDLCFDLLECVDSVLSVRI